MKLEIKVIFFILIASVILRAEKLDEPVKFKADKVKYLSKKGKEIIKCIGNSEISQGTSSVAAYIIEIYGKKRELSKCRKDVIITDIEDEVYIYGDYAEYDSTKKYAKVNKNPSMYLKKNDLTLKSDIIERFMLEKRSIATGSLEFEQENIKGSSERGVYFEDKNEIILEGNPVVMIDDDIYKSDIIAFYPDEKKAKLLGNVRAEIYTEEQNEESNTTNKGTKEELQEKTGSK